MHECEIALLNRMMDGPIGVFSLSIPSSAIAQMNKAITRYHSIPVSHASFRSINAARKFWSIYGLRRASDFKIPTSTRFVASDSSRFVPAASVDTACGKVNDI